MLSVWLLCLFPSDIGAATPTVEITAPPAANLCTGCHGPDGAGNVSGTPRIAGMDAGYLSHTLKAFKSGQRSSETMQAVTNTLSNGDINALSEYFSALRPRLTATPSAPSPDVLVAGKVLALQGGQNGVPACFGCHAARGAGNGERYPRIAGQPAAYVVKRLHDFQTRARIHPPKTGSMTDAASRLTETQIIDIASYLSVESPQ